MLPMAPAQMPTDVSMLILCAFLDHESNSSFLLANCPRVVLALLTLNLGDKKANMHDELEEIASILPCREAVLVNVPHQKAYLHQAKNILCHTLAEIHGNRVRVEKSVVGYLEVFSTRKQGNSCTA